MPDGEATLTDARGNPYTLRFNRFGSVIETTDPIGRTTLLTRDENDLVRAVTAPSDGELPDGAVPGTVVTELDYDALGNVTLMREAAGTTMQRETRFTYEPVFNQVTRIIDPSNALADPTCATATVPSPGVTCFEYDANGNQTRVIDGLGGMTCSPQAPSVDMRVRHDVRVGRNRRVSGPRIGQLGLGSPRTTNSK